MQKIYTNHGGRFVPVSDRTIAEPFTVSVTEAACALGIGRNSILSAVARGDLRAVKIGGRRLIVAESLRKRVSQIEPV